MVPEMTNLQFFVLGILMEAELSGRELRQRLAKQKKMGLPAFYRLMARLEDAKWVKGWYVRNLLDDEPVRVRMYRITASGIRSWEATRDFHVAVAAVRLGIEIAR